MAERHQGYVGVMAVLCLAVVHEAIALMFVWWRPDQR